MISYRISEDSQGRVTVSEIDSATRRVVRSARFSAEAAERLLVCLAKSLPESKRVRRTRLSLRTLAEARTMTLFESQEVRRVDRGTTGHSRTYNPLGRRVTESVQ